jgi:hypothetical protein
VRARWARDGFARIVAGFATDRVVSVTSSAHASELVAGGADRADGGAKRRRRDDPPAPTLSEGLREPPS